MTAADTRDRAEAVGSAFDPVTGLDFDGLTIDEEAHILQAHAVIFALCQAAASRELAGQRPGTERELADATAALEDARTKLEGPEAIVTHLKGELAATLEDLALCRTAADSDDRKARIRARSERLALEQEAEELEERVRLASLTADPFHVVVIDAERKLKTARMHVETLDKAIKVPFASGLGMATRAYLRYLRATGGWLGESSPEAEKIARAHLKESGLGRRVQEDAINAYLDGDPDALRVGHTKTWPDGTSMLHRAGQPPVVYQGRATPQDLASAPVVNTVPGPSGAEVMTGVRAGAGWPIPPPEAVHKSR